MAEKATEKVTKEKNVGMAIVAYIIFFVPLLTDAKDDPFVKFHVRQGLVLFIAWIAAVLINVIPLLGQLISFVASIALLVLWIMGIINAANGQEKELPLIGQYAKKLNI